MAQEAEISAATITNWYKRNTVPSLEAIIQICVALGFTLSEFFNEGSERVELSVQQKDLLSEWDLLHRKQKDDFLRLIKGMNNTFKNSNPL